MPRSRPCTYGELTSPAFRSWILEMGESPDDIHRKIWEWALILDVVRGEGLMGDGFSGLGFAVGREPLPAVFAKYGCNVLATDIDPGSTDEDIRGMWVDTGQHASRLADLNDRGICDPGTFVEKCDFAYADMNDIPDDFHGKFDFVWSSCALEHLGSIKAGQRFILESMKCLRPGGVAVHTTEYNMSSNLFTVDSYLKRESAVIFRKRDFRNVAKKLEAQGDRILLDFTPGDAEQDLFVNRLPAVEGPFLRFKARCDLAGLRHIMKYWPFVQTSYGIVVRKGGGPCANP